jgi:hypothetical protein
MLDGPLGKMVVVDEPVELASATGIESNFYGRTTESGEEGGFEVALEIEHHIEGPIRELNRHFDKTGKTRFAFEKQNFIDCGVALDDRGSCLLQQPGDVSLGSVPLDGVNDW